MKITLDDQYILKAKQARMPDKVLAAKLGITEEELDRRFQRILAEFDKQNSNGYNDLLERFTLLANQYQLVGESLKVLAGALDNLVSTEELRGLIDKDPNVTVANLQNRVIVLGRYIKPDPEAEASAQLNQNKDTKV